MKSDSGKSSNTKESKPEGSFSELAFFIAINVLVVPFSGYQTYVGYKADVAGNEIAAIAIAAISAILFAAMNFGIRERRLKGKPHGWQVLMYLIPLGISFAGNFNAFYSNQMKSQLYDSGIADYKAVFNKTLSESEIALLNSTGIQDLKDSYEALTGELEVQYNGNSSAGIYVGWGSGCNDLWPKIKSLLKEADPSGIGIMNSLNRRTYEGAMSLSDPVFENIVTSKEGQINEIMDDISNTRNLLKKKIDQAKQNGTLKEDGIVILDELTTNNNRIGNVVETYLNYKGDLNFKYEKLKPSEQNQLSTIKYSFQNGFVDMPSSSATYFSLFLSLIIDLAAILYILFFVKNGKLKVKGRISSGPKSIN